MCVPRYSITGWKDTVTGDNGQSAAGAGFTVDADTVTGDNGQSAAGAGFTVDADTGAVYVVRADDVLRPGLILLITIHGRSQDFKRVGAPRGGCRISVWGGGDGGADGPERGFLRVK